MAPRFSVTLSCVLALLAGQSLLAQGKPAEPKRPKSAAAPSRSPEETLAAADRYYGEKNYRKALEDYRSALRRKAVSAKRKPLVEYRIARCLGFTEEWDEAFPETLRVAVRYPGTIWEARSRSWLMRLYLTAPHEGWMVGDRLYRGKSAPQIEGDAPPREVDLNDEDRRKALQNGELSKAAYEKSRDEQRYPAEEADLDADLARVVGSVQLESWGRARKWAAPDDPTWQIDPARNYQASWAPPKKVLYLYENAALLGDPKQKPLARLSEAMWLRDYQRFMKDWARTDAFNGERKPIPYPYERRDARQALEKFIRDYPDHPETVHARVLLADWLEEDGKLAEALAAYREFLRATPKGMWADAARQSEKELTRVELQMTVPDIQSTGKKASLPIAWRNVTRAKFIAHRVRLEELARDERFAKNAKLGFEGLLQALGGAKGARKYFQGEGIAWEAALSGKEDYARHDRALETPLTRAGAYVIEADAGPVQLATILVVSDLAVVQLSDQDRATAMVVNGDTGAPVFGANTLVRELFETAERKPAVASAEATTGNDGLVEKPLSEGRRNGSQISTLAWKGDRYAFVTNNDPGPARKSVVGDAYVYTERPVYRPAQPVQFRALLTDPDPNGWKPLAGQKTRVRVLDPKGAVVDTQVLTTGEFGSLNGKVELGSGAALGVYQIALTWGDKDHPGRGNGSFRVEEYKKPEFQVAVETAQEPVRVGEPATAKISARYYFGGPVANARVEYTVEADDWSAPALFPEAARSKGDEEWAPAYGGLSYLRRHNIAHGTAVTSADGTALVKLDTHSPDPDFHGNLVFHVHAAVTDASRRTIEGDGELRALASGFHAAVRMRHGFVAEGAPLEAEIRTADGAGQPVAVSGTMRVLRLTATGEKLNEQEVHQEPLRIDETGRATFRWNPDRAGRYEVRFEARDAREQLVTAGARGWVAGEAASEGVSHEARVVLVPEQHQTDPGAIARVLIVAEEPGLTLLLAEEAGTRILEKRVIRLTGRSQVVELPLTMRESPDVVVSVTGIRGRRWVRNSVTVQVPPTEKMLHLAVSGDKTRYQPGERATLHLRATDRAGRPIRTECSVSVADAALAYIQEQNDEAIGSALYPDARGSEITATGQAGGDAYSVIHDDQPPVKTQYFDWKEPSGLGNFDERLREQLPLVHRLQQRVYPAQLARSAPGAVLGVEAPSSPAPKAAEAPMPVRTDFVDTAFWTPAVVTGENGEATVTFTWPDNITRWHALARGWSKEAQVGEGSADLTTSKDLLVRLQAPRFFVERDEVTLSANVHNYTAGSRKVRVSLQLGGQTLYPAGASPFGPPQPRELRVPRADRPDDAAAESAADAGDGTLVRWVDLPQGAEKRVDWKVRVERPGEAHIRVSADTGSESDAAELKFPVVVHGVEKLIVKGGALSGGGDKSPTRTGKLSLDLPAERATDSGELTVQLAPSVAATMLDALPYVVDYPYGCVEQTMSRFLPAVVTTKTLKDLGVDLESLRKRSQAEAARYRSTPADRSANSGYSYPAGVPGQVRIENEVRRLWEWRAERSPVYNAEVLARITGDSLSRLRRFQHADGGWGWWEKDASGEHMTAYVVYGLLSARSAGVEVPAAMIDRGVAFLEARLRTETGPHELAYLTWVLSHESKRAPAVGKVALEQVYPKRESLNGYTLALLAMTLKRSGHEAEAKTCLQNLENTAQIDRAAGTCSWTKNDGNWWHWYNDDVEAAATCLRALDAIDPKSRLAPLVVRWLVNNRAGDSWKTTRETAVAIQALAEYVKQNQELSPDYTVTVEVAGRFKKSFHVTAENALLFDNRFVVPAPALGSGPQSITVTREGKGTLYYTAYLRYFTLEEGIKAAGNEIQAHRRYFRLAKPGESTPKDTPLTEDGYVRTAVKPGERLTSGDLLEVELLLESKNHYEYLVFEDMKPAGCEPVDLKSGERYADGLCSNMELRDRKVAFFLDSLPQGKHLIRYRLRAEVPGQFHALPLNGYAMYAPALRCLSEEANLSIEDAAGRQAEK